MLIIFHFKSVNFLLQYFIDPFINLIDLNQFIVIIITINNIIISLYSIII